MDSYFILCPPSSLSPLSSLHLSPVFLSQPPALPLYFPLLSLLKKPGYLSHRVSFHWLWLNVYLLNVRHLTLSSIAWVSCELAVAPRLDQIPVQYFWQDHITGGSMPYRQEAHEAWLSPFLWHWDWSVDSGAVSLIHPLSSTLSALHLLVFMPTDNHCLGPLIH